MISSQPVVNFANILSVHLRQNSFAKKIKRKI